MYPVLANFQRTGYFAGRMGCTNGQALWKIEEHLASPVLRCSFLAKADAAKEQKGAKCTGRSTRRALARRKYTALCRIERQSSAGVDSPEREREREREKSSKAPSVYLYILHKLESVADRLSLSGSWVGGARWKGESEAKRSNNATAFSLLVERATRRSEAREDEGV